MPNVKSSRTDHRETANQKPWKLLELARPAAWTSRMIGRTLAANCAACALRAARMRYTAPAGSGRA